MKRIYRIMIVFALIDKANLFGMQCDTVKKPDDWEELTAQNSVIAFDLDETIIERPLYANVALQMLWHKRLGLWQQYKKRFKHKIDQLAPVSGNIGEMIWIATQTSNRWLQQFVPALLELNAKSHRLQKGTPELFAALKEKKYETMYATNKSHISYWYVARVLDDQKNADQGYVFSQVPHKILVTHPPEEVIQLLKMYSDNMNDEIIPKKFADLIKRLINATETDTIHHASLSKPDSSYFVRLKETAGKKYVIFFDDKKANVDAANKIPHMIGIQVKNPQQVAHALISLGILDPQADKELLSHIFLAKRAHTYSPFLLGSRLFALLCQPWRYMVGIKNRWFTRAQYGQ